MQQMVCQFATIQDTRKVSLELGRVHDNRFLVVPIAKSFFATNNMKWFASFGMVQRIKKGGRSHRSMIDNGERHILFDQSSDVDDWFLYSFVLLESLHGVCFAFDEHSRHIEGVNTLVSTLLEEYLL